MSELPVETNLRDARFDAGIRWMRRFATFSLGVLTGVASMLVAGDLRYVRRVEFDSHAQTPFPSAAVEKLVENRMAQHEVRLDAIEGRISTHLVEVSTDRVRMYEWVERQQRQNDAMLAKLDALCRAVPAAKCPLGLTNGQRN